MPTSWPSVLLFIALVAPGLLFDQLSERRLVRAKESAFREVSRIVVASLVFSGTAIVVTILAHALQSRWFQSRWFLDLAPAIRGGWGYVNEHLGQATTTLVLGICIAMLLAAITNWLMGNGAPKLQQQSAWSLVLKPKGLPAGWAPYAHVTLNDGSLARGKVTYFSPDHDLENRELVLQSPIQTRAAGAIPGASLKLQPHLGAVVVAGKNISRLDIEYVQPPQPLQE